MKGSLYYNIRYAFIPRKPLLLGRLVWNTLVAKLLRKPLLRYVDVSVSTKCNLNCQHCFAAAFEYAEGEQLTLDQWDDITRQCMKLGSASFGITGGEPLMYEQLMPLIERMQPSRNLITINSNGTLLTESLAERLYEAGVDVFQFSLDSFEEEEHDFFRNMKGIYARLFESIKIATDAGLKVTIVCTVSHQTIMGKGVKGIIDFTEREGYLLILSRATPAGAWMGRTDILLTEDDQAFMYGLVKKYAHVRTDMDTNFGKYGCSAATEKIYITPSGYVIPCPFMHIQFGNAKNDTVLEIRNRMLSLTRLNSYSTTCHVAEDHDFIKAVLSKTFKGKELISWEKALKLEKH
jgi:MoaA/NifB/PqqE/SkfB family radical SAM enzyme